MELEQQEKQILLLDSDTNSMNNIHKCLRYVWEGQIDVCTDLADAQHSLSKNLASFDTLILSLSEFSDENLASWILATGYKGKLILLLQQGESAPDFLPCELIATINKPVKVQDFNEIFCKSKGHKNKTTISRKLIESILKRRDGLAIEFQPQYVAKGESLWGFECLTRFFNEGTRLDTLEVIKEIEKLAMMDVFCEVFFKRLAELLPAFSDSRLSINLSLYNIDKYNLTEMLKNLVKQSGISTEILTLEFSNDAYFSSSKESIELLCELKSLGFQLAIDGYQGDLSKLKGLPLLVDEVKFRAKTAVKSQIDLPKVKLEQVKPLSKNLSARIVFSDIETYQQVKHAIKLSSSSIIQGYYLAPPVKIEDAIVLKSRH